MKESPFIFGSDQGGWEHHSMERDIILAHELIKLDVLRVLPPLLIVLLEQVGSYGDVPDGCIEPHIKNFFLLSRDWDTPFEISGDTLWLQPLLEPRLSDRSRVGRPITFYTAVIHPFLQLPLNIR